MPSLVRTLTLTVLLTVVIPIISLSAQTTDAALGTWKLNVAKSRYEPGPAPKEQILTYEAAGRAVRVTSQTVDAQGNNVIIQYSATYDEQAYPVSGGVDFDTTSLKSIDPFTVEGTRKLGGKFVQTFTRVVSPDRKTLTITTTGTNARGQRVNNVVIYERQ
jgi:hypothetical protein